MGRRPRAGGTPLFPDAVYSVLADTSEQMLGDQTVPERLSVAEWRVDLDTQSPIEHIRADQLERGTEGLRAAMAGGMKVGANTVGRPSPTASTN